MCLKSEFIGLASITELPVVIVDRQRGGLSTGLPNKTNRAIFTKFVARHGLSVTCLSCTFSIRLF